MPERAVIEDFLSQRNLAFVGVSRDSKHFANVVYRHLRAGGRILYPVNAAAAGERIENDISFVSLADVPEPVDGVVIMVPAASAAELARQAADRGIPRVWFHRGAGGGSATPEAVQCCRDAGMAVVDGACPLMFDPPVRGVHRLHRMLSGRRVAA